MNTVIVAGALLLGYLWLRQHQGAGGGSVVERAKADMAQQLGVDRALISVGLVESVTWPDSSLGCPKPGQMYAQAMVTGQRIVLLAPSRGVQAGTERFEYHAGGGRLVLCTQEFLADFRR